ncbi:MAG: DASS family sodium-coupled anion symporter [Bacteroidetes bacterium]|nr:DASS family sodium-coupled anion symporter [Bacteroidota bacterium]
METQTLLTSQNEAPDKVPPGRTVSAPSRRRSLGLIAGLIVGTGMLLAPAPPGLSLAAWHVATVGLVMAVWWTTEALPIAATSLLPLVAFPLLGVQDFEATAAPYAHPLIFLFMGGFMIALAMERWNLHRRIALIVIRAVGTAPRRLVAGFMLAAGGLSMWISNTATAMMMLPIGLSVVTLVHEKTDDDGSRPDGFGVTLMLGIAYACSLGGLGTLIGTPTNAFLAAYVDRTYGFAVSFVDWMLVGVPLALLGGMVVFAALTWIIYPLDSGAQPVGRPALDAALDRLGPVAYPERVVGGVFGTVALLWMTRSLLAPVVPGLSDALIAMSGALVLFAWPARLGDGTRVLDWSVMDRLPWGVLLLFGGGLSLADAVRKTGLATWIGESLTALGAWPLGIVVGLVVLVIVLLTELTSNTATAAAFLPVLGALALGIGEDPLLLMVPATVAASCAFMLPVATPPNAIIYSSGEVTIGQMARAGVGLNLLFVLIVTALAFTIVPLVFGVELGVVPPWAR